MTSVAAVASVALAGVAGAVVALVIAASRGSSVFISEAVVVVVDLGYAAVAVVVSLAKPGHLVGRYALIGTAALGLGEGAVALGERGLLDRPGSVPGAAAFAAFGGAARGLGWLMLVVVLPLVFPDGALYGSRARRRWSAAAASVCLACLVLAAVIAPEQVNDRLATLGRPIVLPAPFGVISGLLSVAAVVLGVFTLVTAIAGLIGRWRNGNALVRQQLLWLTLAFPLPLLLLPVIVAAQADWLFGVAILPVPVAIGVGMLQYRLYDVQLALSRTLTWVALSAVVATLYAVTVGGVGAMLRSRGDTWLPWLAAGVIAVSFAPLRNALQSGVNRLVYGQWSQAADVLAGTGRRLADASDVPALLHTLTDELGAGLGLHHVDIRDSDGRTLATYGAPEDEPVVVPLTAYGEVVGALQWSGRKLRDADHQLLDDVARQLGGVVHTSRLVGELRDAQERLVVATEDERRRLRRDLHDGLGPALAGLTLQVDTVRNILAQGGPDVDARLLRLRAGIQGTVRDVRRLVEGLRPPALDELGLAGAIDELAQQLTDRPHLPIEVHTPALMPPLAAAVEVAAYRVAQEALTNAVRHSGATECSVEVEATNGELRVRVRDNGTGLVQARPGGIGLAGMYERASEIGGTLLLSAQPGSGTTVTLSLPVDTTRSGETS
ncbi:sensor histidine kinase (plasmid) [Kribbella sp. CWNU-51]